MKKKGNYWKRWNKWTLNYRTPKKCIEFCINLALKLPELWNSYNYWEKIELQNFLFEKGIIYDRKIDDYRTENFNSMFYLIASISASLKGYKKEKAGFLAGLYHSVARREV